MSRTILEKLRDLTLNSDDRLLREYGLVEASGKLTYEGTTAVVEYMFKQVKPEIVKDLRELEKQAKTVKKVKESK